MLHTFSKMLTHASQNEKNYNFHMKILIAISVYKIDISRKTTVVAYMNNNRLRTSSSI